MRQLLVSIVLGAAILALGVSTAEGDNGAGSPLPPLSQTVLARVVFLGDSITDGNTYPQLVRDSLAKSKNITVIAINAGIGGNTMLQMNNRLQRDVIDHNPTLVTISAGANDSVKGVTAEQYEAAMRATVAMLTAHKIPVILLTPCWWPRNSPDHPVTDNYEVVIRKIAAEYGLRVAEVTRQMSGDDAAGLREHSLDGHPGYTGQKSISRAVLDAMGFADVPVIDRVTAVIDKDVILEWQTRPLADSEANPNDETVTALKPDQTWKSIQLPFASTDYTGSDFESLAWLDDMRQEGMAVQLNKNVGPGTRFISIATLHERRGKTVLLQTAGEILGVWVNGHNVLMNDSDRGWHIGRDAVQIELNRGGNTLVVESGADFWTRMGDNPIW